MMTGKLKILAIGLVMIGANLLLSGHAGAYMIGKTVYEDIGDKKYFNDNTVLIVGQTRFVQNASVKVKAYFDSRTGNEIIFENYHYCPTISSWDLRQDGDRFDGSNSGGRGVATNDNVTKFSIRDRGATTNIYGKMKRLTGCSGDLGKATYKVDSFAETDRDDATGKFVVTITVTHVDNFSRYDGIQNGFRIRVNKGSVMHAAGKGYDVTMEKPSKKQEYKNYVIKFGSSCDVKSAKRATIEFYDLDNRQAGVQPNTMNIQLRKAKRGSNKWDTVTLTVPTATGGTTTTKKWEPLGDNENADTVITFTANKDEKYELLLHNIYDNNTIQFGLPYDGKFYDPGCMEWELEPTSAVKVYNAGTPSSSISSRWADYAKAPATYSTGNIKAAADGRDVYFMHEVSNVGASAAKNIRPAVQTFYTNTIGQTNGYQQYAFVPGTDITTWSPPARGYWIETKNINADRSFYYHSGNSSSDRNVSMFRRDADGPSSGHRFLCQRVAVPYRAGDTRRRFSKPACVQLKAANPNFNLVPETPTTNTGGRIDVGAVFRVTDASIENEGQTGVPGGASGRSLGGLIRVVVPSGANITTAMLQSRNNFSSPPPSARSNEDARKNWACGLADRIFPGIALKRGGDGRSCSLRTWAQQFSAQSSKDMAPNPADPSTAENLGNLISPGDRVCYFIAVSKYNHNAAVTEEHNRTSQVVCVTVAKSPLVQITGGDVIVRGGNGKSTSILTSHAVINRGGERTYGSWIEYAAFAPGSITTHTAGVLKGGAIGGTVSPTDLTFANTGGGGKFGALAQAPSLMDNFANWSNIEGEGTWNISNANTLETGTYYQRTGTVRISQPLSNFNKSVVIEADTIEINGNITYANPSGGYTKLRDLPQLVLKADTIIVGQAVTNIDAWLLAGKISTCGAIPSTTYYSGLNTSTCNTTLTVNGPIQTESLYLRRTAGAEGNNSAALSTAAEKLNLRADAYLWLQGQSTKSAGGSTKNRTIRTEYIRELSPRY